MSAYELGNSIILSQYSTDPSNPYVQAGLVIKSQNEILTRLNDLDSDWSCLDNVIKQQRAIDPVFLNSWNAKLSVWKNFASQTRQRNYSSYLPFLLPGGAGELLFQDELRSRLNQIDIFRSELVIWDQTFRRLYPNAVRSCPAPLTLEQYRAQTESSGTPWWVGPILTTFVIGGVVYIGVSAYRAAISAAL